MTRSRSRSRSREKTYNNSIKADSTIPPSPTLVPNPAPTIVNRTSSFGNLIAEGFAWGTGTAIAKNIFSKTQEKEEKVSNLDIIPQKSENNEKMTEKTLWEQYHICIEKMGSSNVCDEILSGSQK